MKLKIVFLNTLIFVLKTDGLGIQYFVHGFLKLVKSIYVSPFLQIIHLHPPIYNVVTAFRVS